MHLAILGYGEVGRCLSARFADRGWSVVAYRRSAPGRDGSVVISDRLAEALSGAKLILSCVWPRAALPLARRAARGLRRGQLYADLNTTSPSTAERIGEVVLGSGAGFGKFTILESVKQHGAEAPLVGGGPDVKRIASLMRRADLRVTTLSADCRAPAALKIARSFALKAVVIAAYQSLELAEAYGIRRQVVASVDDTLRRLDWKHLAADAWRGPGRREGEMREVVKALTETGVDAGFASATRRVYGLLARSRRS